MAQKKILLIDDSEFILEATSALLMFEDYDVITANNGSDGIALAVKELPDLIICDVSMPKMSGYEVVTEIRANPATTSIPFIFLTAFTEKSKMREGMERGANDYLTKPFTKEELYAAINSQWKRASQVEVQLAARVETVGKKLNYALPHEFRTVITQLIGTIVEIKENIDVIDKQDIVDACEQMILITERLNRITDNFLLFTKLENFANSPDIIKKLRKSKTDEPFAMINDIAEFVAKKYDRMSDIEIANGIFDVSVAMSSDLLHKLIDELVDNALKFSVNGTKIIIDSAKKDEQLEIKIFDSGIGMLPEQIKEISAFMQFQREEYEQQGVGVGLSIARRIVEIHGGKFNIESEKGQGTTISFTIPLI